jgi:YidC/Oxa1 family membrane protein insertase
MDRNTFTGLFLILIILVGSTFLLKPSEEDIKKEKARMVQDSIAKTKSNTIPKQTIALDTIQVLTDNATANTTTEEFTILQNDKLKLSISNKGGKIASVEVVGETTYFGKPVILFNNEDTEFGFDYKAGKYVDNTSNNFFSKISETNGGVTMALTQPDGSKLTYTYDLPKGSNQVSLKVDVDGFQSANNNNNAVLNWSTKLLQQEKDIKNERMYSTTYFQNVEEEVDYLSESEDDEKLLDKTKTKWVSFKEHFFSGAIINKDAFTKADVKVTTLADSSAVKGYSAKLFLPFNNQNNNNYNLIFYFGSNKFSQLKDQGYNLEQQVKMGWGPLKWINRFLVLPI